MYQTIKNNTQYELTEKKSRFIANVIYVENKVDAENKIKEIKKKYYDAKHNCYAYRILQENEIYEKSSDDGEPSGTAGKPLLSILQKNNLCNVLVIVTRYFGGILLGTGGLVRAYSGAGIGALELSNFINIENGVEMSIQLSYVNLQNFEHYCKKNNIVIVNTQYEEKITCIIEMDNLKKEKLLQEIKNKTIIVDNFKILQEKYVKMVK